MVERDEDNGPVRSARGPARDKLPVVTVNDAHDMAVMLARHNRLLREYARHYLPKVPEEVVEEAVEQTVDWLLAIEDPSLSHGLRYATHALWRECQRTMQRLERRKAPVDRKLGPLTGRVGRVLERLGPRQRRTILLAAQGLTPAQIAQVDNSTAASVRVRLYRARERALELLQESGPSMSAVLLLVPHRVRGFVGRHAASLGQGITPQALATTTLVPLIACSLLAAPAPVLAPQAPAPVALQPVRGAVLPATVVASPAQPAPATPRAVGATPAPQPISVPKADSITQLVHRTAAQETPDDVRLSSVVSPPDGRPVLVGSGLGNGCTCYVMMQSLDGGETWTATGAPRNGFLQMALPPDYPRDPRIFFGTDSRLGVAPYMVDSFGGPVHDLVGLPPGLVAVSAHFDDGDPRLFSASATALWSARIGGPIPLVPHRDVDYSWGGTEMGSQAALGTPPPSPGGPALLVWAPGLSTVPDASVGVPNLYTAPFFACAVGSPCAQIGDLPQSPSVQPFGRVHVGRNGAVLVEGGGTAAFISRDGGRTFAGLPPAPIGASSYYLALAGPDSTPWLSWWRADGSRGVARLTRQGWSDASGGLDLNGVSSPSPFLAAVGSGRILVARAPLGFRCALASGGPWLNRCPLAAAP